jgi:CRP/FNR family transcriptional regulator
MSDAAIRQLVHEEFSKYPKRSYDKGQVLVFDGEELEYVYYLLSGKVRQYGITYRGNEVIINIFKPPAFFPMDRALNRTSDNYFYKTEEPTELHLVPAGAAVAFLKSNPEVALDLLKRVYRGVDGLLGKMLQLMSGTAKSRLAYEIFIECRRFGDKQSDGSFQLETTESDLAARSGLTRETVSREMQKLKAGGCVDVTVNGVLVTSLSGLEAIVHSEPN